MPEKILIVDDDLDTLKLVGLILQRHGYEIVAANGGMQALSKAVAEQPDIILLDLMMPDLDGYEVTRRLRADDNVAHIPIIMFTAKTLLDDKVAGFEAGADDYLTKPTHPAELVAHVKALLARAKTARATAPAVERGKVIGFIAAKGGVGATTLAVNVAAAMAQSGHEVVLADMRPGNGGVALMLGISQNQNLSAIVAKPVGELNQRTVAGQVISHAAGMRVLPAQAAPRDAGLASNAAQLEAIVKTLSTSCQLLLLDLGPGLPESTRRITSLCDHIVFVTEPTRMAILQTKALFDDITALNVPAHKIEIVMVNRTPSSNQLSWPNAEQALGHKIITFITPAPDLANQAAEVGTPIVLLRPDTLTADQLRAYTEQLLPKVQGDRAPG